MFKLKKSNACAHACVCRPGDCEGGIIENCAIKSQTIYIQAFGIGLHAI